MITRAVDARLDFEGSLELGAGAGQIALGVEHPGQFMEGGGDGWMLLRAKDIA